MNLAEKYVTGLKKAYYENGGEEQWDDFEKSYMVQKKQIWKGFRLYIRIFRTACISF